MIPYFTLSILIIIASAIVSALCLIAWNIREMVRDRRDTDRIASLKRGFRQAYRDWKLAETAGDYADGNVHRQNAEMFDSELTVYRV